jgi:hypothetical protein
MTRTHFKGITANLRFQNWVSLCAVSEAIGSPTLADTLRDACERYVKDYEGIVRGTPDEQRYLKARLDLSGEPYKLD